MATDDKRRGLGRGLSALFGEEDEVGEVDGPDGIRVVAVGSADLEEEKNVKFSAK